MDVEVVDPKQLADYFGLLINVYEPDSHGELLVHWFRNDWLMFRHPEMDDSRAKDLLAEILDDGEIVRETFSPSKLYTSDALAKWEQLRPELMYANRFFPDARLNEPRLEELLTRLILDPDEIEPTWFRARLHSGSTGYSIDQMGAPPKEVASHGRANPAGIPYLYLASTLETAVSEIRPHTGEHATIGLFAIANDLKLVDLRNPRQRMSPFLMADEQEIGFLRADIEFLERLGEELTRPVIPQAAAVDYVPSQYLCEFIKRRGYDGVVYSSSVGDGMNLALFDADGFTPTSIQERRVSRVTVEVSASLIDARGSER